MGGRRVNMAEVFPCVVLRADGTVEDIDVDLAAGSGGGHSVIGGTPKFYHYPSDDLIFNVLDGQLDSVPSSAIELPGPHKGSPVKGDVLIVKLVEGEHPKGFTKADYESWIQQYDDKIQIDSPYKHDDDEESDEEYSDEESDEEGGLSTFQALLLDKVISGFRDQHGREPEEEELAQMLEVMNAQQEDDEEGEEEEMPLELFLAQIRTPFEAQQGREPTDAEWDVIVDKLTGGAGYLEPEDTEVCEEEV